MKGLTFRKTSDAIAAFVRKHGASAPRRAVLCTYDLDPSRFEAAVLPELTRRRRWFRTLVLADAASLQKQSVLGQRGAASTYELAPVRVNGPGVFHPKLIVLQAGTHLLVGVGSSNLTTGGLGGNLELMLFATNDVADGRALAESALSFLDALHTSQRVSFPTSAKRLLERVCLLPVASSAGPVLHNLEVPLIRQLRAGRPARVTRTAVVSPWHSTAASTDGVESAVLAEVGKALGALPRVYTQGHARRAPDLGNKIEVRVLRAADYVGDEDLDPSEGDGARVRRPPRLHAKAYLAADTTQATLWFGSANCTLPAMCQVAGRGNVELLVRVVLDREALARVDADLEAMFERALGTLPAEMTPRSPTPQGSILAGYVDDWGTCPRLSIELARSVSRLRVGASPRKAGSIEVAVPHHAMSVTLSSEQSRRIFQGREVPPLLWEHPGGTAIPFPISVPCAPAIEEPEAMLQDALDDLAGRLPLPFRKSSRRVRDTENEEDDDNEDADRDRELDLLTKIEHEGKLDRIAVRAELLRRRIARTQAARSQYVKLIERLALAPPLRRRLIAHLGALERER